MHTGLLDLVAQLAVHVQGVPKMGVGVVVTAEPCGGVGEVVMRFRLQGQVAEPARGGQRSGLHGHLLVPVAR